MPQSDDMRESIIVDSKHCENRKEWRWFFFFVLDFFFLCSSTLKLLASFVFVYISTLFVCTHNNNIAADDARERSQVFQGAWMRRRVKRIEIEISVKYSHANCALVFPYKRSLSRRNWRWLRIWAGTQRVISSCQLIIIIIAGRFFFFPTNLIKTLPRMCDCASN